MRPAGALRGRAPKRPRRTGLPGERESGEGSGSRPKHPLREAPTPSPPGSPDPLPRTQPGHYPSRQRRHPPPHGRRCAGLTALEEPKDKAPSPQGTERHPPGTGPLQASSLAEGLPGQRALRRLRRRGFRSRSDAPDPDLHGTGGIASLTATRCQVSASAETDSAKQSSTGERQG